MKNLLIVRRSLVNTIEEVYVETDVISQDSLIEALDDLDGLSMNLLGGSFVSKDIKWKQIDFASKDWEENYKVHYCDIINACDRHKNFIPLRFSLDDLLSCTFPYARKLNQNEAEKNLALFKVATKTEETNQEKEIKGKIKVFKNYRLEFEGKTEVIHTPNNGNFWHVELTLWEKTEEDYKRIEKISSPTKNTALENQPWRTQAALSVIQYLQNKSKILTSDKKTLVISKEFYQNN